MGIDGISGGGGPPKISPPSGAERSGGQFSIEAGKAPADSGDLEKLANGELSQDEYLDARVEQAVSHLQQGLSVEQLELVRETLREQLESDPLLQRVLQRATGVVQTDNDQ